MISKALFVCLLALAVAVFAHSSSQRHRSSQNAGRATREQIDAAIESLEHRIEPALPTAKDPWALALGLRGLGPSYQLESGALVDRLLSVAEKYIERDQDRYRFPASAADVRVSPSPGALLGVLLESDVKLDRVLSSAQGPVDLATLSRSFVNEVTSPTSSAEWASFAWSIDALTLVLSREIEPEISRQKLATFRERALDQLELEHHLFREWLGKGDIGKQALPKIQSALTSKQGIYAFEGAGLHMMQALLRSGGVLHEERNDAALRRLFGITLLRERLETPVWQQLLEASSGEHSRVIEAVDYYGQLLEVLGWIERQTGATAASGSSEPVAMARASAELVQLVDALSQEAELASLRDRDPERYFAELRAASAALRGLRLARHFIR